MRPLHNLIHARDKISKSFLYGFIVAIAILVVSLQACSTQKAQPVKASLYVFGTVIEIIIYGAEPKAAQLAIQEVEQTFHIMHQEWHAWEPGGIVEKINQAILQNRSIEVTPSVKDFIIKSQQLSQQSLGLFDPGIGGLISLWGFHGEQWQGPPPKDDDIQAWLKSKPSIMDIQFTGNQLSSRNHLVELDFGGNAKGLAIDIALDILQQAEIENALVSIGGDMKAIGNKNNQAWSIAIQSPTEPNQAFAKLDLNSNESVVTSGDYQRYFEWQGKRYSHIINPKTGYPANSFASVTVIHNDAITADAAATAILIAGPEQWLAVANAMGIEQVICIEHDGNILQTESMAKRIKILN